MLPAPTMAPSIAIKNPKREPHWARESSTSWSGINAVSLCKEREQP